MGSLRKSILLLLVFLKTPFFIIGFLMIFPIIVLFLLMILFSTLSSIELLTCRNSSS